MQNIVSIIVPVYNAEKYLSACVDSVLNQTNPHWELVLVDDGSTDLSGKICDAYSQKDERIRTYHKNNGGASSARNYGIKMALGNLITFLDSDDSFENNTIEFIIENIKDNDILRFSAKEIYKNSEKVIRVSSSDDRDVILNRVIGYNDILAVWGGAYRKSIFEQYCISFDESLTKAEDWKILFSLLQKANNVKVIDEPYYLYNKTNECSLTSSVSYRKELDSIKAFQYISKNVDCSQNGVLESLMDARLKLYHTIICQIASPKEKFSLCKVWGELNRIRQMLGKFSIWDVVKRKTPVREKMVDCLSMYRFSFPVFLILYKLKYKNK